VGAPNLQRKLLEESLVSDRVENLNVGNTSLERMGVQAQQEHDIGHWNTKENSSLFMKPENVNPLQVMPAGKAARNHKVGGRRMAKD